LGGEDGMHKVSAYNEKFYVALKVLYFAQRASLLTPIIRILTKSTRILEETFKKSTRKVIPVYLKTKYA
jgi:hypothetical protein